MKLKRNDQRGRLNIEVPRDLHRTARPRNVNSQQSKAGRTVTAHVSLITRRKEGSRARARAQTLHNQGARRGSCFSRARFHPPDRIAVPEKV